MMGCFLYFFSWIVGLKLNLFNWILGFFCDVFIYMKIRIDWFVFNEDNGIVWCL